MRCAWETVTAIINRGVAELLDTRRLSMLYRIGVDEICYRHPHHYLTIIGDHDTGTVIDIQPGRSEESLTNFYTQQPDSTLATIEAVSMDVGKAYASATRTHLPHATICFDPFHIMQWVNRALDRVDAESATGPGRALMTPAQWRAGRWAIRTGVNKLTDDKRELINRSRHQPTDRSRLDAQRTTPRPLPPQAPTRRSTPTPAPLDHRRQTQPYPRVRCPRQTPRRSTSRPSSPPLNSAYPTPSSRASTPKSA